jgi:hypothetical protein
MTEKRVAKTPEVTGRSVRDARGQVVRPRAAALDDGKALGTGWLDLKGRTWVGLPDWAIPIAPRRCRRCSSARGDPKVYRKAS